MSPVNISSHQKQLEFEDNQFLSSLFGYHDKNLKVLENMIVSPKSIRIVDTNIAKSNQFYDPITDSAMRTLLNPECMPLKLPKDKYNLCKSFPNNGGSNWYYDSSFNLFISNIDFKKRT